MYKLVGYFVSKDKDSSEIKGYNLFLTRPISSAYGEGDSFLLKEGKKTSLWLPKDVFESKGFYIGCDVEFACDFNGRLLYNSIIVS